MWEEKRKDEIKRNCYLERDLKEENMTGKAGIQIQQEPREQGMGFWLSSVL
jgi:hypothetical protein